MKKQGRTSLGFWSFNLLILLALTFSGTGSNKPEIPMRESMTVIEPCSIANTTFAPGEEIVYKFYYNLNFIWIPAGEVTFNVNDKGTQYHISAKGQTYSSYEWFFKVRDQYDTYLDKSTLLPLVSIREIQEGGYTLYDKTTFEQKQGKAITTRGRNRDKVETKEYSIDNCMHDMLSIVYYYRNVNFDNLTPGQKFPIKVFLDTETYPLKVHYKGKEADKKIKGLGRFKTIQFSPQVVAGEVFKEGTEMNIWVTDDKNRIPVLIESPVSVGSVKAVLKSYKGLKYDMTAKID